MARASRRKRLWRDIQRRQVTDPAGRAGVVYTPPRDWLDYGVDDCPDDLADEVLRALRASGVILWLHADPADGTVRTRMMFPEGFPHPPLGLLQTLSKYARVLGKAVARSGHFQPPPDNPFGDLPVPSGGHWRWDEPF